MNTNSAIIIEVHKAEIARLQAIGAYREAAALEAALRRFVEQQERADARRPQ